MLLFLATNVTNKSNWLRLQSLHAPAFNAVLRDKLIYDIFFATCRFSQLSCLLLSTGQAVAEVSGPLVSGLGDVDLLP